MKAIMKVFINKKVLFLEMFFFGFRPGDLESIKQIYFQVPKIKFYLFGNFSNYHSWFVCLFNFILIFQSSPEVRIMTEDNRSVLMLPITLIDDAGDYTVRAENVVGSVTSTATLNVLPEWEQASDLQSPVFIQTPVTAKVMDGESALFTAKVCFMF